jgi:urease accessory protein
MLVAESHLGHRGDPELAARLEEADPYRVVLSDTDRQRSRVRTETTDGTDVGIVVGADLGDGAVLETGSGDLVVVELAAVDALVLDFSAAEVSPLSALELGHALGNRHWDLAVRGQEALFPVPDTRERMRDAVADLLPEGVTTRFEGVPPTTFDEGGGGHAHGGEGASAHSHEGKMDHTHAHGDNAHAHDDHTHVHGDHSHGVRSVDGGEDE